MEDSMKRQPMNHRNEDIAHDAKAIGREEGRTSPGKGMTDYPTAKTMPMTPKKMGRTNPTPKVIPERASGRTPITLKLARRGRRGS